MAGLPVPRLIIGQDRAVVGPAGIALHHALSVKHTGAHSFVAIDGGMG